MAHIDNLEISLSSSDIFSIVQKCLPKQWDFPFSISDVFIKKGELLVSGVFKGKKWWSKKVSFTVGITKLEAIHNNIIGQIVINKPLIVKCTMKKNMIEKLKEKIGTIEFFHFNKDTIILDLTILAQKIPSLDFHVKSSNAS